MKKILALVLAVVCILGSFGSAFAYNDGMTNDEVFRTFWELACVAYDEEALSEVFLEDFYYYEYEREIAVYTRYLISEECLAEVREAVKNAGTDTNALGEKLVPIVQQYISIGSTNPNINARLQENHDKYAEKIAYILADSYNFVKDYMNAELITEFRSDKYGYEIAKYFNDHKDEIAALIPQQYLAMFNISADQVVNATEAYLQNNQESIVNKMEEILNSDENLAAKQVVIQNELTEILADVIESFIGTSFIPRTMLVGALSNVAAEYAQTVCEQFEPYIATANSIPNSTIIAGCVCLAVGLLAGILIGKKGKKEKVQ